MITMETIGGQRYLCTMYLTKYGTLFIHWFRYMFLFHTREPAELSSLVDSLLESPKKAPDDPRRAPSVQTLDPNKQAKLREYLSRKTVTKVKSTRPGTFYELKK